jgi:hypothetical protein
MELRASGMLVKNSATELYPEPKIFIPFLKSGDEITCKKMPLSIITFLSARTES